MLSNLRIRLNKSRKLQPVLCHHTSPHNFTIDGKTYVGSREWRSTYGMRSVSDPAVNYQVTVRRSRAVTVNCAGKVAYTQYHVNCQKVGAPDMCDCEGSHKAVCYHALGTIRTMAGENGKRVVFCKSKDVALLKRRIYGASLFEVKSNGYSVWGVAI